MFRNLLDDHASLQSVSEPSALPASLVSFLHKSYAIMKQHLTVIEGTETVQVTPLRTLASSHKSECASCFDTVGWTAGRASGL